MALTTEQIEPFFQVVILRSTKIVKIKTLLEFFKNGIKKKFGDEELTIKVSQQLKLDNPIVIHFTHTYVPTWLKFEKGEIPLVNKEHDLLIIYQKDEYIFLHCQCKTLLEQIIQLITKFNKDGVKISKLKSDKIHTILHNSRLNYKALGIKNVFGSGGTAPEAKSYYGRRANYNLTPSFDTGFGFNYCFGSSFSGLSQQPFGCSTKHSKVWRTWTNDLDEFVAQCDEIFDLLGTEVKEKDLNLLVSPTNIDNPENLNLIEFYMDYAIPKKGSVVLVKNGEFYPNWSAFLDIDTENEVFINLTNDEDKEDITKLNVIYEDGTKNWKLMYLNESNISVVIADEGEALDKKRKTDLVKYLNEQKNFTLIFSEGIAFRDEVYWEDNRLKTTFKKTIHDLVDWIKENTDITKEEKNPAAGKTTILETLERHFKNQELIFGINDNAANEIADIVVITNEKFILLHAKASGDTKPGLRVNDIQVVSAQAIKNLRYFILDSFGETILKRLHENIFHSDGETLENFVDKLKNSLKDFAVEKECWIVQPGISKIELEKDLTNKIHTILNIVDSACSANNVKFKLIASP